MDDRIPFVGVFFADGSAKLYRAFNRTDHCYLRPIDSKDLKHTRQSTAAPSNGNESTISTVASVQQRIQFDKNGQPQTTFHEFTPN